MGSGDGKQITRKKVDGVVTDSESEKAELEEV